MCCKPDHIPRLVAEHHADPGFSVERLARLAGMSTVYLREITRRMFRTRPHAMINNFRLHRAACLLLTTRLPIESIALQAGYPGSKTFRRAFRRTYGCSPSAIRRRSARSLAGLRREGRLA